VDDPPGDRDNKDPDLVDVPTPNSDDWRAATAPRGEPPDSVDAQSEQSFPASDPPSWPGASI
jgi:hypothetical protein